MSISFEGKTKALTCGLIHSPSEDHAKIAGECTSASQGKSVFAKSESAVRLVDENPDARPRSPTLPSRKRTPSQFLMLRWVHITGIREIMQEFVRLVIGVKF